MPMACEMYGEITRPMAKTGTAQHHEFFPCRSVIKFANAYVCDDNAILGAPAFLALLSHAEAIAGVYFAAPFLSA